MQAGGLQGQVCGLRTMVASSPLGPRPGAEHSALHVQVVSASLGLEASLQHGVGVGSRLEQRLRVM